VEKQSDRYYVYNRGDFFRDQMQKRAPGTPAASTGYRLDNTPTYFADVWAEAKPIPDQLRGNADAVLNMDRDATEFLTQQALIRREKIFAGNLFTTGKWKTDMVGQAANPGAGQFLQWNDGASTPIEDVRAGKLAIKQATGYPANTLVVSEPVWPLPRNQVARPSSTPRLQWTVDEADKLLRQVGQAERKQLLRMLVGEVKLVPQDLEVTISYRLPEAIMNGLVAGDCNAPNAHAIRYEFSIT